MDDSINEIFTDNDIFLLTNALLDRLLHHCTVVNINGSSYRLKDQMQFLSEDN